MGRSLKAISKTNVAQLMVAMTVFSLTLLIKPYYTGGDQRYYTTAYAALSNLNLVEGAYFYFRTLASQEITHFVLSWIASRVMGHDVFIAILNAFFSYTAVSLLLKWHASLSMAILIVLTNFYFLVFFFTAERLKVGIMFLALSILYSHRVKAFYFFSVVAMLAHVQVAVVYFAIMLKGAFESIVAPRLTKRALLSLIVAPLLLFPLIILREHIILKLPHYIGAWDFFGVIRVGAFMILALFTTRKRVELVTLFAPVLMAAFLVGGHRIVLFGYFLFLYYGLQLKGGKNIYVLTTNVYFFYSSIEFLTNVLLHGHGFPGHL